jgi:hypothetical protein
MPSGGLMQLVSYGSENLYLTGNPQITFFKTAYRRHTNFAYEWVPEYFKNSSNYNTTGTTTIKVALKRNGDLVRDVALVVDLPSIYSTEKENFKWVKNIGHVLIKHAEIFIGGQSISKLYGQWMNIWYELINQESKRKGFNELTGNIEEMYNPSYYYGELGDTKTPTIQKRRLRIPIPFWFTEHPGLALPLISIQYTEVTIQFEINCLNDLFTMGIPSVSPNELFENPNSDNQLELQKDLKDQGYTSSNIFWKFISGLYGPGGWNQNMYLDIKYVYLDTIERRVFAAAISEYLITQVERREFRGLHGSGEAKIEFYHPVKEMVWVYQRDDVDKRNQWTNYTCMLNDSDYTFFKDLVKERKKLVQLGLTPGPLNNCILPSGLTVGNFINSLNFTDTERLSLTNMDAFDSYLNIFYYGRFVFNGHNRQIAKTNVYYLAEEPYDVHTYTPDSGKQIHVMSFAESPEQIQPSGSANFSMYKESQFYFTLKNKTPKNKNQKDTEKFNMYFYCRNINVLRIMNGIGGLVFAN